MTIILNKSQFYYILPSILLFNTLNKINNYKILGKKLLKIVKKIFSIRNNQELKIIIYLNC